MKEELLIKRPDQRMKLAVSYLKTSFDSLKDAREELKRAKTGGLPEELIVYEELFQKSGRSIMDLAKKINRERKKEANKIVTG